MTAFEFLEACGLEDYREGLLGIETGLAVVPCELPEGCDSVYDARDFEIYADDWGIE